LGAQPEIRNVRKADLEAIEELERRTFDGVACPYFVLRQFYDIHRAHWLVAADGGFLCGNSLSAVCADRWTAWIVGFSIHPDRTGEGIGTALLTRTLERLRSAGVHQVCLTVKPGNIDAIRLYKKAGFVQDDEAEPDYLGPGEHRIVMTTPLGGATTARRLISGRVWRSGAPGTHRWRWRRDNSRP
jgi:ribosomal protein S18 acetylase RimI-like enzyme